jgi:hypothetical protein
MHLRTTCLVTTAALLAVLAGAVAAQADDSLSAPIATAMNESDSLSASDDSGLSTTKSNIIPDATQAAPQAVAPAEAPRKSLTPAADVEAAKGAATAKAAAAAQAQQAAQAQAAAAGEGMDPSEMMEAHIEAQQEKMEAVQEQMQERIEEIGEVLSGGE